MYPYVEPTVQTADKIDIIDLQTKFDKVNDVATEQKKQKKIEDTIETVIGNTNSFNTFEDFWWEDDMFSNRDSPATVDASKNIINKIQNISDNILGNIRSVDQFMPIDDRTQ